ncbi:MDR family MFS transporter [Paenibacillaceae sp. P-4]|uniref:DHA2 family efflux MFS transporter permease subunit n=1 Tax=Paenibacillus popilliae TaxID=78057 RepID=A0ABY3AM39_PAEPP|nr:MDR family MFS transporter [Paenibacillus sp. SDF0028]TQR43840.1 DHA2 family efflux MFS transporter permease subunit [Paenibacillus sp. SDF0028]
MITKESNLRMVVAGLLLGILMAAMDNTIVATAMPTIVGEMGGFNLYVWVTSAYMVATMAGMPIFGKLSDMYGRKRFYVFGLLVFLVGSALCGTADSMIQLAIYRAIQGIGGGAVMPIAFTIIFDVFPPEKRGKMTGLFGAVFGVSSVAGPLLGAYITQYIGWEWVFYINLPLGLISLWFIMQFYKEKTTTKKQRIDWGGAITLVVAIVSFMFALELGGKEYAWDSTVIISLFAIFLVFLIAFLIIETRVQEPIISFNLFKRRLFAASQGVGFFYGVSFVIATVYIPLFVQWVYGGSATDSGLVLTPMMIGSVVTSSIAGIMVAKRSYRSLMIVSGIFFIGGMFALSTISTDTPRTLLTLYMVLTGLGVGFSFSLLSMSSMHGMEFHQRGAANSTASFSRSLGMTIGITLFGTIQSHMFQGRLQEVMPAGGPAMELKPETLMSGQMGDLPPEVARGLTTALADSIASTFQWALIPVACALVCIALMGNARMIRGDQGQGRGGNSNEASELRAGEM